MDERQVRAAVGAFEADPDFWRMVLYLKEIETGESGGAEQATVWAAAGHFDADYAAGMLVVRDGQAGDVSFIPFESVSHVALLRRADGRRG